MERYINKTTELWKSESEVKNEGQTDLLFTMLMAEATGTDPFEMEQELRGKGLIN